MNLFALRRWASDLNRTHPHMRGSLNVRPQFLSRLSGISVRDLKRMRDEGTGPPYRQFGRTIFYSTADVEKWMRSQVIIDGRKSG